jgi:hypothetical protein
MMPLMGSITTIDADEAGILTTAMPPVDSADLPEVRAAPLGWVSRVDGADLCCHGISLKLLNIFHKFPSSLSLSTSHFTINHSYTMRFHQRTFAYHANYI